MGVAPHPGIARAGASFELERLELDDGRLVVRGWWFGVRGVRFVRPGLVVDGRRVLATLEHKPWAVAEDGGWTAAFPWKRGLDVAGVTLVVAPTVEVPLDRDAEPTPPEVSSGRDADPLPRTGDAGAGRARGAPGTVVEELRPPLRDELEGIERQLDAMHAELREARATAAEREARCRELEHVAARERRVAHEAEAADEESVRARAMALLDRDRALAQHVEAVNDREAAVRARKRMEAQRDEALAERAAADARCDEALAARDEARKQRDELLLAHQALQAQLKAGWASDERAHRAPEPRAGAASPVARDAELRGGSELARGAEVRGGSAVARGAEVRGGWEVARGAEDRDGSRVAPGAEVRDGRRVAPDAEAPLGVRTIPAARTIAASLHRSQREREHGGVTRYDMWAIRILGSVAALSFISLLVMILKAFFVF